MGEPVDSSPPDCSSVLAIFQCISLSLLPIATLIVVAFRCALECSEDGGLQFISVDGLGDIAVHACGKATDANPLHRVGSHGDDRYSKKR
jgi:hypothetical protein